jgi:hypothetical protein
VAGYAANARLDGSVPHFVGVGARALHVAQDGVTLTGELAREPAVGGDWIELVGRPFDARLADRLASIGEAWSQMTFFLFDPESWR